MNSEKQSFTQYLTEETVQLIKKIRKPDKYEKGMVKGLTIMFSMPITLLIAMYLSVFFIPNTIAIILTIISTIILIYIEIQYFVYTIDNL